MGFHFTHYDNDSIANSSVQSKAPTFALGNINFYVEAQPFEHWRALVEVRLTNYPDGDSSLPAPGQPFQRTNTTVYDVNSPSGGWSTIKYGSIVLERAFLEWAPRDWFSARLGYFPTPYGIWNVDHGTPTRIALSEPQFVVVEAFPSKQLGLDLTGNVRLSPWDLEYHAYVSNGRTPGQLSLANGKAFGGRLVLKRALPSPIAIGVSGYYGRYDDVHTKLAPGTLTFADEHVAGFKEWGVAADLSVDAKHFRFRSEFVLNQRVYDEGDHSASWIGVGDVPSRTFWGTYGLLAYQLPWLGLEPFVYAELDRNLVPQSQGAASLSGGLNVHITPGVQLKLQYTRLKLFDFESLGRALGRDDIDFFASRVVMAF
jgi:hypothetical protein